MFFNLVYDKDTARKNPTLGGLTMYKQVILYFSNTGHTQAVAQKIAAVTGAKLLQLIAKQPYTTSMLVNGSFYTAFTNKRTHVLMNLTTSSKCF